ncbi:MAG: hypothetical protein IH588_10985 [Anaerolineales bacterium]|nr:hypothetical protein [Anaerolineales bacterium]
MKNILPFLLLLVFTACDRTTRVPPTVTATLTLAPTATITPTATPVPEGPCVSPFLPLITGNEWTYRATSRSGESLYKLRTLGRNDGRNIIIMVEFADLKHEVTVVEPVVCMDGAVENFPLFVMSMHFADYLEKDFNTYHDKGIYAPSYQTFVGNDWVMDWDLDYLTESSTQLKNPVDGQTLSVLQSSFIKLFFEMDGAREMVTVPVGSYPQALKVQSTFSFPVTLLLLDESVGGTLTVNTTQWYEPYVGLVRAQVDSASMLLYGKEIDISMVSIIELVEFKQGE